MRGNSWGGERVDVSENSVGVPLLTFDLRGELQDARTFDLKTEQLCRIREKKDGF